MPTVKPVEARVTSLKDHSTHWFDTHDMESKIKIHGKSNLLPSQDFYSDMLTEDWRKERFVELAEREGISKQRAEKILNDGKVHKLQRLLCCGFI